MYLGQAERAIGQANSRFSLKLPPAAVSVATLESLKVSNPTANRDDFDITDFAQ